MSGKGLVTKAVLAEVLDLTVETVRKYTRENKIPCIVLPNGDKYYDLDAVILAITENQTFTEKDGVGNYYSYNDYLKLPKEPSHRNGNLEERHQISARLVNVLENYWAKIDPRGVILTAPIDVILSGSTVTQPDVIYISSRQRCIIKEERIDGVPNLVVEISSPKTRTNDNFKKLQIYLKAGVQHYWLIDPTGKSLHCFALQNEKYIVAAMGMNDDVLEHPDFAGLTIQLGSIWDKE